ncbi:AI-2E family transporter [Cutibacterium avidum]|uniref:AI-2E family transporter n=1 Tax=Cutibacterium avidum TaxID=33010 RepID=UPI000A7F8C8B|nr:AI-2E family transporter [Cutibacterium avidum]MDK7699535.1 AI-2E family transporter [Cutibacterium avidum]
MKLFGSGTKTTDSTPVPPRADAEGEAIDTAPGQEVASTPQPITATVAPAEDVPSAVRTAAGWCWRLIVIAAFIYGLYQVLHAASEVSVPVAVALMLTAAMWPLANWLSRHHIHRGIASGICLLLLIILVGGVFTLVGAQIAMQWRELGNQAVASFKQALAWLANSPLHTDKAQLNDLMHKAEAAMAGSQGRIASTAAAAGTQIGRFTAGLVLALFATFFFVYEGDKLAEKSAVLIPREHRAKILDAAKRGWVALVAYVRAAVIVAFVDGLGAGIGAAIIGSSMSVAIGALTFILAFVPIVGALTAGVVAVGVVLVTLGFFKAVIMLIVFVAVMQIEGHVLQPFLLGKAVSIHPLIVLVGIAVGAIISGIVGALFAIPIVAFGVAFIKALSPETPAEEVPPSQDDLAAEHA